MLDSSLENTFNELQIVVSYDTSFHYNFYCLPWLITKRYMNRHIFLWKDHPYVFSPTGELLRVENEVFLMKNRFSLYQRQLYELLWGIEERWEMLFLSELWNHAKYTATMHNLFLSTQSRGTLELTKDFRVWQIPNIYHELITNVVIPNNTLTLIETITAQTLRLLWYQHWQQRLS